MPTPVIDTAEFAKKTVERLSDVENVPFQQEWYQAVGADHFWMRWRYLSLERQLKDLNIFLDPPSMRMLEVGGGHGILRQQLEHQMSVVVDLCDLNFQALQMSPPSRGRTLYYDIMARREEFREAYDAIFLFDVLEHIEHTDTFVQAINWHLKPKGYLIINVPAIQLLYSAFDAILGHFRRYSPKMLCEQLEPHGLSVINTRHWGMALIPFLIARWVYMRPGSLHEDRRRAWAREGVTPPNLLMEKVFRFAMRLESAAAPRPPIGTSVLCVCQKVSA
jgi:2-polyprenyl-3-methyl-5-hydroxy-6-metoxy-1,4-benzoquinol methylase